MALKHSTPKKETCLQTDWSRDSMGYLLLQKHFVTALQSEDQLAVLMTKN